MSNDDMELVRRYATHHSEPAFETLVSRHVGLVHSAALRQARDPHLAEEITQTVFTILARKAGSLSPKTILPGWLYRTTRYVTLATLKIQRRRERREQEAHMESMIQESHNDTAWEQLAPLLDEAMAQLRDQDRDAIVLRYFQNKSLRDVGAVLGVDEYAAQKRVVRALEKLRTIFVKRGAVSTTAIIAGLISANSVQAAPMVLAKSITAVAITQGAASSGTSLTLIKGALKLMAWSKVKVAVVVGVSALLAAGTTTAVMHKMTHSDLSTTDLSWAKNPRYWAMDERVLDKNPPVFILRPTQLRGQPGIMVVPHYWNKRFLFTDATIPTLISMAYQVNPVRIVVPDDLSDEHYDLMLTLSGQGEKELQQKLKQELGLTAHFEERMVDVIYLRTNNVKKPGLILSGGGRQNWFGSEVQGFAVESITNTAWSKMFGLFDSELRKPVIDQTGLHGNYDLHLKWKREPGNETDNFKQVLSDQLGIEVVPGRGIVNMLVVDKVR